MTTTWRRVLIAMGAAVLAGLGGAGPAAADSGKVEFSLRLSSSAPGTPTGMTVHALARGEGKPPPLRSLVYHLPAGIRFDTKALPECAARDAEIQVLGPGACPADSRIATGKLTAISGFGPPVDPFNGDAHVFNGPDQIIEIVTFPGSSVTAAIDRVTISGSTLTAHPPMAPGGPPDGEMAVKSIDYTIAPRVTAKGSLITAPPDCPATGDWTTTATFGFGDGASDTETSLTPCDVAPGDPSDAASARPTLGLTVGPGRIPAGRRVRVGLRLTSSARRCASGAKVRLGGRTVRADTRGRAIWVGRFRRAGDRRAVATNAGCAPATAVIHVVAARRHS